MLVQLRATGFRNLEPLDWRPGPGVQLVVGHNGAGKTSLLEAAYVLATTRSFRTPQLAECVRHGGAAFALGAEVEGPARAALALRWTSAGRQRSINGRRGELAEHLAALPVVTWTDAQATVLVGAPSERRRFLDRGVVSLRPATIAVLYRYRRALAAKRAALAGGSGTLEPWNAVLAAAAAEVIRLRGAYVARLAAELAATREGSRLPLPPVTLRYRPSPAEGSEGAAAIAAVLRREAAGERATGRPLVGPHRDDFALSWAGRPARRMVSAGERKALGLLLLAAQGRLLEAAGRSPLHLLDDADAELDRERLATLWGIFSGVSQLVATSSRPEVWSALEVAGRWRCAAGRIEPG